MTSDDKSNIIRKNLFFWLNQFRTAVLRPVGCNQLPTTILILLILLLFVHGRSFEKKRKVFLHFNHHTSTKSRTPSVIMVWSPHSRWYRRIRQHFDYRRGIVFAFFFPHMLVQFNEYIFKVYQENSATSVLLPLLWV